MSEGRYGHYPYQVNPEPFDPETYSPDDWYLPLENINPDCIEDSEWDFYDDGTDAGAFFAGLIAADERAKRREEAKKDNS